jgi:hypothetical protein
MITGGCHCGAVRYSIEGEPLRSAICSCADCRRSSGAPLVAWALFAGDALSVTGDIASFNSSGDSQRQFCSRCGSSLFYRSATKLPGLVNVLMATLDEPERAPPAAWVQATDAPNWLLDIETLPNFDRYSGR